jgi:hypothetical protein
MAKYKPFLRKTLISVVLFIWVISVSYQLYRLYKLYQFYQPVQFYPPFLLWHFLTIIIAGGLIVLAMLFYLLNFRPRVCAVLFKPAPVIVFCLYTLDLYLFMGKPAFHDYSVAMRIFSFFVVALIILPACYILLNYSFAEHFPAHRLNPGMLKISFFFALFLLLLKFLPFDFFVPKPLVGVNYIAECNELSRPQNFNPSSNAWPYLQKTFAALVPMPDDIKPYFQLWPGDMNESELESVRKWIVDNDPAVDYFLQASRRPYSWSPYQTEQNRVITISMPELKQYRALAQLTSTKAGLLAWEQDISGSLEISGDSYKIGTFLSGKRTLVEQLVGIAIRVLAVHAALECVYYTRPDANTLSAFQQRMSEMVAANPLAVDFSLEKLFLLDEIQRNFTDDGKGGGYMSRNRAYANGLGWQKISRKSTLDIADKCYVYIESIADKTPLELKEMGAEEEIERITSQNPFVHMLSPAYLRVINLSHRCDAETQAVIVILALERFKIAAGSYPDSLVVLKEKGYIDTIPLDPFSGKPFMYRKTKESFTLYSYAYDFDDDGGSGDSEWTVDGDGDFVFWPLSEKKDTNNIKSKSDTYSSAQDSNKAQQ